MAYLVGEKEAERFRDVASSMLPTEELASAEQAAETQRMELGLAKTPEQN